MENSPTSSGQVPEPAPFELGIVGLPVRVSRLARGMIYGLVLEQQSLRLSMIGAALLRALRAGGPAAVLTPQEPAQFLRKLALNGVPLDKFVDSGLLKVFCQRGSGPAGAVANNPRRLLQELQGLDITRRSLVVLDHADDRFCASEPATARLIGLALQEWVDQHEHTLIATFASDGVDAASMVRIAEPFAGFATTRQVEDDPILELTHWFGAMGAVARASYTLEIDEHGALRGRPSFVRDNIDPEHELQLATQSAALDFTQAGPGWETAESMLDAVDKARRMVGGTVVLHFDPLSSLRELAQAVAVLRAAPRPQLRIIVRECGARLRVPQVAALMRLGMNMIIPQEVTGASAQAMAESLRGTLSNRHYEVDVDRLLSGAEIDLPSQVVGVGEFRRRVAELLARAQELEVPVCLVRFSAVSPQAMRAVLGALSRGRNCVFTQHDGGGWMLLYGCLPERAAGVLARLLGARYESLLADFQLMGEQGEILRAIRLLEHAAVNLSDAVFETTITRVEYEGSPASGERTS